MSGARCMHSRGSPVRGRHCGWPASMLIPGQAANTGRAGGVCPAPRPRRQFLARASADLKLVLAVADL